MFKKKTGTLVISEPDPSYKVLLLLFFIPQVVKIPGVKNYKS